MALWGGWSPAGREPEVDEIINVDGALPYLSANSLTLCLSHFQEAEQLFHSLPDWTYSTSKVQFGRRSSALIATSLILCHSKGPSARAGVVGGDLPHSSRREP